MYRVVGSMEDRIIRNMSKRKKKSKRKFNLAKSQKRAIRRAQKLSHLLDNLYRKTLLE